MPAENKPADGKMLPAVAALALIVLAALASAQSGAVSIVENAPFMGAIKGGVQILLALIGFASMVSAALLAAYGLVMYVLSPTQWYRWQVLINLVENYKWLIVGAAAFPLALAAAVYGVDVVLGGYGAGSLPVKPEEVAVALLQEIYTAPFQAGFCSLVQ